MSRNDAIGIVDSGIGGLTIWKEIKKQLPNESFLYVADHAYAPYGNRSVGEIRHRAKRLIGFLLKKNAKIIVIACNTATVAGIDAYRKWFPVIPIIGVVPVVKTAAFMTKTKHIAVLSTPFTASSIYQKRLIKKFAKNCDVENIGVPELVSCIEKGQTDGRVSRLIGQFLNPETMRGVDVIALGCTHYPFVRSEIEKIAGKDVAIIDSGGAVGRHTVRILDANKLRGGQEKPYTVFYTTGNAKNVTRVAKKLMGESIRFTYVRI